MTLRTDHRQEALHEPDADRLGPVPQRLTHLLHRVVSVIVDHASDEFREFGLSIPATRAIVFLLENGGEATVGIVAEATSIDLSTISHILRRIEQLGFIIRERKKADNRVVLVKLTPLGYDVAAQCQEASRRHEALVTRGMAAEELALLKRLLRQAYDNVHADGACTAEEPKQPAKPRARKHRPFSSPTGGTEP